MFDLILSTLTGGATGVIGSVIGKAFSFVDYWVEEKKADKEHGRTLEMLRLQNEIGEAENEREMAVAQADADANMRMASYKHDASAGVSYPWVAAVLRLVRPTLTVALIVLVGIIFFSTDNGTQQEHIVQSVLYLFSSCTLWWFGDRALRSKK